VRVQIVGKLPDRSDAPLICYFNHPGWWDVYASVLVDRHILRRRFRSYGMMEEPQLRAYRFFTWCGGFSINRHNPREAARSVAYISRLLREQHGSALYMFPQGTITPNDQRPLVIYPGMAHIVSRAGGATLYPVALRYEFRGAQRPEAFIRLGPVHRADAPVDIPALTDEIYRRLTASVDALRDAVVADDMSTFRVLLRGRPGIDRLFDYFRQWWNVVRP
jgi:1-acyl-sn-glycerol-3-phosphate acyltransferase